MKNTRALVGLAILTLAASGCGKKDGNSSGGSGSGTPNSNPPASLSLLSQADASKCKVTFDLSPGNMQEISLEAIKASMKTGSLQLRELEGYTWGKLRDPKDGHYEVGVAHIYSTVTQENGEIDFSKTKPEERCTDDSQLETKMSVEMPSEVFFPSGDASSVIRLERLKGWSNLYTQVSEKSASKNLFAKTEKAEDGVEVSGKYYVRPDGKYESRFMVISKKPDADLLIIGRGLFEFVPGAKKVAEGSKAYLDVYKDAYAFAVASNPGLNLYASDARDFAHKVASRTSGKSYLASYKDAYAFAVSSSPGLNFYASDARDFAAKVAKHPRSTEYLSVYKAAYAFGIASDKGLNFYASDARDFAEKVAGYVKGREYLKAYREAYLYAIDSKGLNLYASDARAFAEKSAESAIAE